jgi:hypothetical protein
VSEAAAVDQDDKAKRPLKKGDQVKYVGSPKKDEAKHRVVLGKISTSDGQKSAFTVIPGRWVGHCLVDNVERYMR